MLGFEVSGFKVIFRSWKSIDSDVVKEVAVWRIRGLRVGIRGGLWS